VPSFLDSYQKIKSFPGGHYLFNKLIGYKAPFFAKISPNVIELNKALSVVEMKDRRSIRNHIGSVNAGAMCTLAELSGGLALDAAIPRDLRWLPRSMTVEYLKKAKGTLIARCEFDPKIIDEGDIVIPLDVRDAGNEVVFKAKIVFYISKKKTN
jgi:acyl-coenzyme A thioesterase PaaI-like protein